MSHIPEHVPADLVRTIGLTMGAEFLAAPHEFMATAEDALTAWFRMKNGVTASIDTACASCVNLPAQIEPDFRAGLKCALILDSMRYGG